MNFQYYKVNKHFIWKDLRNVFAYSYANYCWNRRTNACPLQKLACKTLLILVYCFSIMPGLSITCASYCIGLIKTYTVWECSQQGLKYPSSNDICFCPYHIYFLEESTNRNHILASLFYPIFKEVLIHTSIS